VGVGAQGDGRAQETGEDAGLAQPETQAGGGEEEAGGGEGVEGWG